MCSWHHGRWMDWIQCPGCSEGSFGCWTLRLNHLPKTPDLEVKYVHMLWIYAHHPGCSKSWQSWRLSLESPNWFTGSCHPGGDEPASWVAGERGSIQKEVTSQSTILSQWDMGSSPLKAEWPWNLICQAMQKPPWKLANQPTHYCSWLKDWNGLSDYPPGN